MRNEDINPLIPLGAGIALGGGAIWALIELWPILLIIGGGALALKGFNQDKTKENDECNTGQKKN